MKATLKGVQEDFYVFSGKTSEISRYLALAGIGVIWLFKTDVKGNIVIDEALIKVLRTLILCLVFDFLHAFLPSFVYGGLRAYFKKQNKKEEDEVEYHGAWEIIEWSFFALKIGALFWAYWGLWQFVDSKIVSR